MSVHITLPLLFGYVALGLPVRGMKFWLGLVMPDSVYIHYRPTSKYKLNF